MQLDAGLISQFVKATNDDKPIKSDQTVFGTVVIYEDKKYVKMDGSELLTPIAATTKVENDERVIVTIKNHSAIVTGNLTSPSAREVDVETIGTKITEFETIIADKVDTLQLNVVSGRIDDLQTDFVTVKDSLVAANASITNLETDNVTVKGTLTAANAEIENLKAHNVTITGKLEAAEANIGSLQADNAIIRGDLIAQNGYFTNLESDYAEFKEATIGTLEANEADIKTLYADKLNSNDADLKYAKITNLEAADAKITNLESTFGDFKVLTANTLAANKASIEELESKYAEIESLDTKYANIDFANIGDAAIETLFSKSGLIEDIVVGNGTITGNLVGVTIKGDLIEGGTVVADKLVVKGEDGLYYKLNTDGVTTEAEQTDYNSLNGSVITAKSITATKIAVDDLVAFDATIGGFKITDDAIHSVVKDSVNNTTRGIYLDNIGQMAVGDAANFIKYYKDKDGTYKLAISADSLIFSSGGTSQNVETFIEQAVDDLRTEASSKYATKTNLSATNKKIDELEVGVRRNYLLKSDKITSVKNVYNGEINGRTRNGNIVVTANNPGSYGYITIDHFDNNNIIQSNIKNGEQYTFSFDISCSEGSVVDIMISHVYQNHSNIMTGNVSTSESRVYVTGVWETSSVQNTLDIWFCNCSGTFTIGRFKFEKGDKPTDWCPALEDIDSDITMLKTVATNAVTRISSAETQIEKNKEQIELSATKAEVTESLSGYYTKTQTDAAIKVAADEVSSTVESTYATKDSVDDAFAEIESSKSSITQNSNKIVSLVTETTRLDNKFNGYSTTTQMDTAIEQSSKNIRLEVSQTYTTQAKDKTTTEVLSKAILDIDNLKNAISTLVTGRNGESLMIQTENGWQFNMKSVLDTLDSNTGNVEVLANGLSDTNNKMDLLDKAVVELGEYTGYINFALDNGLPCIILGQTDSDFKVKITNAAIKLMQGTNSPAIITNNRIEIETAYIRGELQQGGFAWAARSNGNYGLVWR